MKFRSVLFILLFVLVFSDLHAQSRSGDADIAGQYVKWAEQAIEEGRWSEALTGLERAYDFASVSSDISWLLAFVRAHERKNRNGIMEALDRALETNRWVDYNAQQALLLKAQTLIGMRDYYGALAVIEQAGQSADSAMLRLLALKGAVTVSGLPALARFRSSLLETMDRYPRDPRPLRIFFTYAHNKDAARSRPAQSDFDLLELVMRRLPFLLEDDPDLAWMAAYFMSDTEAARRLTASYRAGAVGKTNENFRPNPRSAAAALNLGLIGDSEAVEELFSGFAGNEGLVLDEDLIVEIGDLLRSEEGRELFTRKLLSFSGVITFEEEGGYAGIRAYYRSGVIREALFDLNLDGNAELRVVFAADGVPVSAERFVAGVSAPAFVQWERYPSVRQVEFAGETFLFRSAGFQFAPVVFTELGGSKSRTGLDFPFLAGQNTELTRRALVSFCASIRRPCVEFDGAVEEIFLEGGIPRQAVVTLDGKRVSITEFERGFPVLQRVDLDLDGRMETIRRFRRPGPDFEDTFDYHGLIASSESDWTGEGVYKTGEVYLQDGSVVYSWDVDGSGTTDYSETVPGREK
jgi:tetratricopeptide (TPR) repeat protein